MRASTRQLPFADSGTLRVLDRLAERYGEVVWDECGTPEGAARWQAALNGLGYHDIAAGLRRCLANDSDRIPTPSQFRSWCRGAGRHRPRSGERIARGTQHFAELRQRLSGRHV